MEDIMERVAEIKRLVSLAHKLEDQENYEEALATGIIACDLIDETIREGNARYASLSGDMKRTAEMDKMAGKLDNVLQLLKKTGGGIKDWLGNMWRGVTKGDVPSGLGRWADEGADTLRGRVGRGLTREQVHPGNPNDLMRTLTPLGRGLAGGALAAPVVGGYAAYKGLTGDSDRPEGPPPNVMPGGQYPQRPPSAYGYQTAGSAPGGYGAGGGGGAPGGIGGMAPAQTAQMSQIAQGLSSIAMRVDDLDRRVRTLETSIGG